MNTAGTIKENIDTTADDHLEEHLTGKYRQCRWPGLRTGLNWHSRRPLITRERGVKKTL